MLNYIQKGLCCDICAHFEGAGHPPGWMSEEDAEAHGQDMVENASNLPASIWHLGDEIETYCEFRCVICGNPSNGNPHTVDFFVEVGRE